MSAPHRAPDVLPCTRFKMGRSVGHIMFAGPVYTIEGEGGHRFTFEWHPYFGPSRCSAKTGDILGNGFFAQNSKFWPLFQRWMDGGKVVDEFHRCLLAPPPPACDASCKDCGGRGWYRHEGGRAKFACLGARNVIKLRSKDASSGDPVSPKDGAQEPEVVSPNRVSP